MVLSVVAVSVTVAGTAVATSDSLTFDDQTLGSDGAVTVGNVSTDQNSTVLVTYTNQTGSVIVAGVHPGADELDGHDVQVAIEDAGGFPGEHTAWVFDDRDFHDITLEPGDDVLAKTGLSPSGVQNLALDFGTAQVTEQPTGSLTFDEQTLGSDGAVTVANVSTDQNSTVVVTYTNQTGSVIVAGVHPGADELDGHDVQVAIEDAGGFPGEHTAWVFADEDLEGLSLAPGDDVLAETGLNASQVQTLALDFGTARVTEQPSGSLTFEDQPLGSDGAVTVGNVSTDQNSTVVVTYTNQSSGEVVVAGTADADELDSHDVPVAIEDTGGFPGEHTAWVFADEDLEGLSLAPGDDVLAETGLNASQVQTLALDVESARVTNQSSGQSITVTVIVRFDFDDNGRIEVNELGAAATAYILEEISIRELGTMAEMYVQT